MRRQNNVGCDGTTSDTVSKICNCETSGVSQVLHIMRDIYIITTNDWQDICPPSNFLRRDHRGKRKTAS